MATFDDTTVGTSTGGTIPKYGAKNKVIHELRLFN